MTDIRAASIDAIPFGSDVKRTPPARSPKKEEETSMAWYVSYRTGGSTVMHLFKRRELAIAGACELLNRGSPDALQVGPDARNTRRKRARRARPPADPIGNARFGRSRVIG